MNIYLCIIVAALLLEFFLNYLSRRLDLKNLDMKLPDEFKNYYSEDEYARSQEYLRENTQFALITSSFNLFIILSVILLGLFNVVDVWVRNYNLHPIPSGLIFFGILLID